MVLGRDTTPCLLSGAKRGDPRIRKSREVAQFTENPERCHNCRRLHCAAVFSSSLPPFGDVSLISPDLALVKQQLSEANAWPRTGG